VQARARLVAPIAAVAWVFFGLLGLAVKLALFRSQRTPGAVAVLWGLGFGLFLWAGSWSVGLELARAIPFGLVAGASIALFVYLRGAGLENPPAAQPGAVFRRVAVQRSTERPTEARDIHRARVALVDGDLDGARFYLREAEKVAVAQGKPEELAEVRELQRSLGVAVPGDEPPLAHVLEALRSRPAGGHALTKTRELVQARAALGAGDFKQTLYLLQEAARVAIAQRRLDELLEVYELVQSLVERSSGRTRAAAEALAHKVEAGLRTYS
jgi:hypothetical protein